MTIPTEPGIYRDVPNGDYDEIPAVRRSFAWDLFKQSPKHARWIQQHGKTSKALSLGTMVHLAMLQPEEFPRRYAVMPAFELDAKNLTKKKDKVTGEFIAPTPENAKKTGYYKDRVAEFEALCGRDGIEIVPQSDYDTAYHIGHNIRNHDDMQRFFQRGSRNEAVSVWRDEKTGLLCKARYDCLVEGDFPTAVDVKTTSDGSPWGFLRSVRKWGYYFQTAWYLAGLRAHSYVNPNFLFAVAETFGHYEVTVYELEPDTLRLGAKHCRAALDTIAECERTGVWPGYGQGIVPLQLSENELKELDDA